MAERRPPNDWTEELLVHAGATIDYPATPDIAGAVRARLAADVERGPERAGRQWPRWVQPVGVAAAVLGIAVLATLSFSSETREAVADFLGLGVEGERIEILPDPEPGTTATPFPPPAAIEQYATPVALRDLESLLGFEPARPEGAGDPIRSYFVDYDGLPVAVVQYADLDLWQMRLDSEEFQKGVVGKGASNIVAATVNLQPAFWITGNHTMFIENPPGIYVEGSERTVERNTLVWRSASGINYRIETDLDLEKTIAIAATLP